MKIVDVAQGSLSWMLARSGIATASEFDNLVTPEFKVRTGQMLQSYVERKVAEAWLGGPLPAFNAWDMDQGQLLEQEAVPFYTLETGEEVTKVGLITTDDGKIGCSPDGLLEGDCGLEVKCPAAQTHVRYLVSGSLPKDYAAQVHGGMFVTGFTRWKFMSYHRRFPALIITVHRDEAIQAAIGEALGEFEERFRFAFERICELNGGPPIRPRPAVAQAQIREVHTDITP